MTQTGIVKRPLHLIRGDTQAQEQTPLGLYLAKLQTPSAKRSQRSCLRRAARLMGAPSAAAVEWGALRYSHVELLKERMLLSGYQPATINAILSALKGVAREAWLLKQGMEVEDYQRIAAVRRVRAS